MEKAASPLMEAKRATPVVTALLPKALALELRLAARDVERPRERPRKAVARGTQETPAMIGMTACRNYA